MTRSRRLPRFVRLGGAAIAVALVLAGTVALVAPVAIRGRRFGRAVEALLPPVKGAIHVGGGRWSWAALLALARGAPAPVDLDDLRVLDPEGTEVLFVRHLSARVQLHNKPLRVVLTEVRIEDGRWRFARLRAGSGTGFLAAFEGARTGRGGAPSRVTPGASLSLVGVRLEGVETVLDLPDWSLHLRDVHATGGLELGAGPLTFDVSGADVRAGGSVRIGALAPVAFSRGRLDRVTTARSAPDTIRLEASGLAVERSRFDLASTFDGVHGVSRASAHPTVDAQVLARAPADLLNALAAGHTDWRATGDGGTVAVRLAGPFDALGARAEVRGLTLEKEGARAEELRFDLAAEPSAGRFRLRALSLASPAGGRVAGDVTVDGPRVHGELTFTRFATDPFLPKVLGPFAAGTLEGRVRGHLDLEASTFGLDVASLVLRRTRIEGREGPAEVALTAGIARGPAAAVGGPTIRLSGLSVADGALQLPRFALSMWGARFVARGHVQLWDPARADWLKTPLVSLDLGASRLAVERVTGLGFARGTLSFTARLRGSLQAMTLELRFPEGTRLSVLDEPFSLPRQVTMRLDEVGVEIDELRLHGTRGSELRSAGRIAFAGPLALDVTIARFPLDRLPGFARTELPISGLVSGRAHLGGAPGAPSVRGQISLDPVMFQDRPVGGGLVTVTPGPGGAIRARGHLIDGIGVDGALIPKREGLAGEATLTFARLPLEPFLPELPGGITATGVVSGHLTARLAPGQPVTADGRLSELALLVTPPGEPHRPRPAIELHAEQGIPLAARSGSGPISIGPARFAGTAGTFELWGQTEGEAARGSLRGRIQLGPFAPLLARWSSRLAGSIDVDLAARLAGPNAKLDTRGTLTVAAPIQLRLVDVPVDASVTSGTVHVAGDALETAGLAVTVHAAQVPYPPVNRIEGRTRVFARLTADVAGRAQLTARVAVDALDLYIRELGATPVHAAGGTLDLQRRNGGSVQISGLDLPLRGDLRRFELSPVFIDKGRFEARVEGRPDRALRLAGIVTLDAARVRTAKPNPSTAAVPATAGRSRLLGRLSLDLRLQAPDGAVVVEIPHLPDLRVGLDMHVGGTAAQPTLSGEPHGANLYSRVALVLGRLFR